MADYADLYSDYLLVNQGQTTATGLSALLEGELSHDQLTRYLSGTDHGCAQLWHKVKPLVRKHADAAAVLIIDDTVQAKPHMDENELICWHYDHCANRSVKGVNQLSCLYDAPQISVPVSYALVSKPVLVTDPKTGKAKRTSLVTKQELFRQMVSQAVVNKLVFSYLLGDIWFCCKENINHVAGLKLDFIFPIRDNRRVYLSEADKALGLHQPISALGWEQNQSLVVWLPGVDVPLSVSRHFSKDGEDTQAVFYLLTNDLTADAASIKTCYAKRWKIEEFHKSIKSNLGYAQSPAHTVRTQSNHLFLVMLAFVKLELLRKQKATNQFALKKKLVFNALQLAWRQLQQFKQQQPDLWAA